MVQYVMLSEIMYKDWKFGQKEAKENTVSKNGCMLIRMKLGDVIQKMYELNQNLDRE